MTTISNGESGLSVRNKLNDALSKIEGTTPLTSVDINSGAIDGTTIGATTPSTGAFTDAESANFDLTAIAETKAVTAVDVFVYDTSKDSDGGAWRKRTQHTSWYNETLNTATRGSRREFPAVAVIVAEATKVTIYDGDDPALPMWMVFNRSSSFFWASNSANARTVTAKNSEVVVGKDTSGIRRYVFSSDTAFMQIENAGLGLRAFADPISFRNSSDIRVLVDGDARLVNNNVNDVAMTVLPDAPIDPATGLPVPTIAVATDGGVSVIADNGSVYDSSETAGMAFVAFNSSNRLFYNDNASDQVYYADIYAADGFSDGHYDTDAAPYTLPGNVTDLTLNAIGQADGLTILAEDPDTQASGMVSYITSSYQTGYMNGDIKLALGGDSDDTDLVEEELVANGDFTSADISAWNAVDGATLSVVGQALRVTAPGGQPNPRGTLTVSGLDPTKVYVISGELVGSTAIGNRKVVGTAGYASGVTVTTGVTGSFLGSVTGVTSVTIEAVIRDTPDAGEYADFTNISLRPALRDNSVAGNHAIIHGTITRSPVATGADLVALSGFSASNYLEQPYNSDLDFGTGDFAIMGWLKQAANTAVETILERDSAVSAQRFTLAVNASGFLTFTCDDDTTARTATSNRVVDNDVWTHLVALYDGAGDVKIYLNGVLDDTETGSALLTLNNASAVLRVGLAVDDAEPLANADLALLRISATVPSDSQIKKIYEDEKVLFQEGAQATLYGASDAVTALAHDPDTNLLHVGTSAGRSVFQGLRRVSNTTTAVGTAISASNGLVVEE